MPVHLSSVLPTKHHSGEQTKKPETDRAYSTYGKRRGAYKVLVGKPERRKPFGRLTRRWEDNVKTGLREVRWGHELDRSGSGQEEVAGCC
jgi:hypothetical protein